MLLAGCVGLCCAGPSEPNGRQAGVQKRNGPMVCTEMAAGTRGAYWNHSARGGPAHASCPHASSFFCGRRSAAWSGGNFQRERRAPGRGGVPPKGGERSPEGGEVPPEGASLRRASAARSCVFQPAVLGQLGWEGARSAPSRCGCGFSHCLCACVSRLVFVFARLGKMALALWRFGLATGGRLWSQGVYLCGCRDVFGVVLGVVCDGECGDLCGCLVFSCLTCVGVISVAR